MPRVQLSAAFCAAAECKTGKRKTDYWDTITTGFVLEVRASGGKSYYIRFQDSAGAQRALLISAYNDVSFDQARKAAKRLRSEVVLGGNPLAEKQVKKATPTYATLAEQHIAHAKTYQRSWWSTEGIIRKHLVPRWGRMRLDEITSQDIAKWLAEKAAAEGLRPATIEKIRVVMGKSFALAAEWQMPGGDNNPVRAVRRPTFDNKRSCYLSAEDAERLLDAAGRSLNRQLRPIVQLLMVTGARVSELLHARWEHFELVRKTWHIPMSKNGKGRHVPLAAVAVETITGLPRFEGSPYAVGNPETGRPFVSIKHAWQTARREAGLPGVRIHDLRHHCGGALVNSGASLYTVAKVLGHRDLKSSERYSWLAQETLLAAVEAGAAATGRTAKKA